MSIDRDPIDPRLTSIHQRAFRESQLREFLGTEKSSMQRLLGVIFGDPTRALRSETRADEPSRNRLSQDSQMISNWVLDNGLQYKYPDSKTDAETWETKFESPTFDVSVHARKVEGELRDVGPLKLGFSPIVERARLTYGLEWEGKYYLYILFPGSALSGRSIEYSSGERPLDEITGEECTLLLSFTDQFKAEQKIQ